MRAYILQVLQLTAISLPTIFVEKSLSQFQLCALNVVRCLFSKYPSHRQLILQDICSSLIKLPCGKRNLRTYPSSHGGRNIQMWVALVMQLLQCCALSDDTTSSVAVNAVGEAACAPSARLDLTMEEARKSAEDCAKMLVLNSMRFRIVGSGWFRRCCWIIFTALQGWGVCRRLQKGIA